MIDLLELSAEIAGSDAQAAALAAAGGGRLAELTRWWAGVSGKWPPQPPRRVRLVLTQSPTSPVVELAATAEVGIRSLVADTDPVTALAAGVQAADDEIEAGADLLLLAAAGSSAAPLVFVSLVTGIEPVALLPRGAAAADSRAWIALAEAIRDRRRESAALRHQPAKLLAALESPVFAAACGFVLRSVSRRTPLVLDGTTALAGALLAADLHQRAGDWWQVADSGVDPAHGRMVTHLGLRPVLDLGAGDGHGLAALLALAVLRAAVAANGSEAGDE